MSSHDQQLDIPIRILADHDEQRCVDLLQAALQAEPGVHGMTLDMPAARLQLRYDPAQTSLAQVQKTAQQLGVELGFRYQTCTWRLQGVRCADCSLRVADDLKQLPGVARVVVNPAAEVIGVEYDAARTNLQTLDEQFVKAGYSAQPQTQPRTRADLRAAHAQESTARRRMATLTIICLTTLLSAIAAEHFALLAPPLVLALYAVSYLAGGYYAGARAFRELRARSINVDLLMIVAALGAAAVNELPEGAVLLFLFSFSNTLEQYVLGYTRRAIEALMDLTPEDAVVRRDGVEVRLSVDELRLGDTLVVRPGERIAADGIIVSGVTSIDQSAMTGESIPVEKKIGDSVFAATLNQQGSIEVRVTRLAGETALARIVQLVEEAQSEKAHSQRFTDWFGQRYTVAVMAASALTLVAPMLIFGESFATAFYRAMTVLVVASPCAVVISIPAAILSAITSAARGGVLFKGGAHLERAARIRAIAFDKTGTLTVGRPQLHEFCAMGGVNADELLQWAASAESLSEHPLAKAVVEAARVRSLALLPASHLEALMGRGVRALVRTASGPQWVLIGKAELFADLPPDLLALATQWEAAGTTTVFVGTETNVMGLLAIADTLRATAAEAIAELRALGVEQLVMLTGDNRTVAQSIAARLHMDYEAQLMPEEKLRVIHRLRDTYGTVAMVGDGINDAPALASSDLGISLSGTGTDVALETADLVLMADDLRQLPYAIGLSRAANRIIRQNLAFAFGMMALLLATTFLAPVLTNGAVALRLPFAVVGHEGSTVLVILNGLRLLAYPHPRTHVSRRSVGKA